MKHPTLLQEHKNKLYKDAYAPKPFRDKFEMVEEGGVIIIKKKKKK